MKPNDPTLLQVADALDIKNPSWLWSLIQFESRWNSKAKAGYPYNKALIDKARKSNIVIAPKYARGLIQFIDSTAQSLGYKSSADLVAKNPSSKEQLLFPVRSYLERYKPFPTKQSLYMAVFYPAARNWPLSRTFPDAVQRANPGIRTVQDYVNLVEGKKGGGIAGVLMVAGLAAMVFLMKRKK